MALVDPAAETVLVGYRDGAEASVHAAVDAAASAQRIWWALTASERGRILWAIGAQVREHLEQIARLEARTAGKPLRDATGETTKVAEMFEYYAGWADKQHGEVIPVPTSHLTYTVREPYGVVAQMTPWNAPRCSPPAGSFAPALAAGNGVVLKPSELSPLTSLLLARLVERAGAPVGLVNVIAGVGHGGQPPVTHPGIAKVVFVGSPETGRRIATAAAQQLTPCVLELGGKSANIVFDDADLDLPGGAAA